MSDKHVFRFINQYRAPDDYMYLLVDRRAKCEQDSLISIEALEDALGPAAITPVLRPDFAHIPESCPALIQLASPFEPVDPRYLEEGARQAENHVVGNRRYLCGWLTSNQPPEDIAQHIVDQCSVLAPSHGRASSPWFEPLRLELLQGAMGVNINDLLPPVKAWLLPSSWGSYISLNATNAGDQQSAEIPPLARDVQQAALLVNQCLKEWSSLINSPMAFAPWRWTGESVLPPQAAVHAFRLIRDAKKLGLRSEEDMITLSTQRVMVHPLLPQHPDIQHAIAAAAAGQTTLATSFNAYSDNKWKRIFGELPRARDYT